MTLAATLQQIRDNAKSTIPDEMWSLMHQATEELRATGIMAATLKPGALLPPFALDNMTGETVTSAALLEQGNLVVTFYRGVW